MEKILGNQVSKVVNLFCSNHSILETAKTMGISTVKVRKILITEGLWESDTSNRIGNLLKQGFSVKEIAEKLCMSEKNVQAYMPYRKGIYYNEKSSPEAVRSDRYRKRMKRAEMTQVEKKTNDKHDLERVDEMADEKNIVIGRQNQKEKTKVLRLHLELDMERVDEEEKRILKEHGSMKNAISRDILVPEDITLHALNYAILRSFGWQNGHLHNFSLPMDIYEMFTENRFTTWAALSGVYFRFPSEEFDDIYWDDDYREGQSIKSWMRKKYTGPYKYGGFGEHYLSCQMEVDRMFAEWDEITVHEFNFESEKQPEPYKVKLTDASLDQVMHAFTDVMCYELLERLPLMEVLSVPGEDEIDLTKVRENIYRELSDIEIYSVIEEYRRKRFSSMRQEQLYLQKYNIPCQPVTEKLCYSYDYGDGWEVWITCEDVYSLDKNGVWINVNCENPDALDEALNEVIEKQRPVCIGKDGIELVDDVGGIRGFCDMLQVIYECDRDDDEQAAERESMLAWANMMGWTGRKVSPRQTL